MLGFPAGTDTTWQRRRIGPVYAHAGMVASAHALVTGAGLDVLRRGGNAVDGAVAAAVTASVVMPEMCGLGGDLFAIVHDPGRSNTPLAYLGSGNSPRSATIEQMRAHGDDGGTWMPFRGPLAVGVPGMVDAYFTLLANHGSRPFADLSEAAVGYAEHGHPITADCASAIAENAGVLARFPSSASVFLANGSRPAPGTLLRQTDLARSLRAIQASGADVFYRGDIARRIDAAMTESGGALGANDLADHRTVVEPPISSSYRGHTVYQTGLPSQGVILLEMLNLMEQVDPSRVSVESDAWVHLFVEATKAAYADRLAHTADPSSLTSRVDWLLDKSRAAARYRDLDAERASSERSADCFHAGDTTYLCVVDRDGMMVSLIQSVSAAFGCGMVAGDTGIVLNNRVGRGFSLEDGHPNRFAPGRKTMHTLNCYLIADRVGTPILVGGTPGGDGQPQWNAQTITAMIDSGLDVQAAIESPRWTVWPGTDPHTLPNPFELRIEDRAGEGLLQALASRGHDLRRQGAWDGGGAAQAISRDPETGVLAGGSDPRVEGMAAGY